MSEFHVEVVRIGEVEKHPYADTLSMTNIHGGYPVIFRTGDYKEGDLAVYIPVDAVVPATPMFEFLGKNTRIKAKRLRNIFSMGLLVQADPTWQEGQNVQNELGITKYETPIEQRGGLKGRSLPGSTAIKVPFEAPVYDLEGLRKFGALLTPGEEVIITEKIHGANARFVWFDPTWSQRCAVSDCVPEVMGELYVGSRNLWKKVSEDDAWHTVATKYQLRAKLCLYPNVVFYGEMYGKVQDLTYGVSDSERYNLRFFDAYFLEKSYKPPAGRWMSMRFLTQALRIMDLEHVPVLYQGPWDPERKEEWAEGKSTLADHVREGFVVRPVEERTSHIGRVVLKYVGQGYLLRGGQ